MLDVRAVRRGRRPGRVPLPAAAPGGTQAAAPGPRPDAGRGGRRSASTARDGQRLGGRQDRTAPAGARRVRPPAQAARPALPRHRRRCAPEGHVGSRDACRPCPRRADTIGSRTAHRINGPDPGGSSRERRTSPHRSGRRAASGGRGHDQAVVDVAPPRHPEGCPGEPPDHRHRPAVRERSAARRRRRRRLPGDRLRHRRPGPRRARQVTSRAGGVDAEGGPARGRQAARLRQGRRPAARPHRGRVRTVRAPGGAVGRRAARRTPPGRPQDPQATGPGRLAADQAGLRAVGADLPPRPGPAAPVRATVHPLVERARRPHLGPRRAARTGGTRPRAGHLRGPRDDAARLDRPSPSNGM
ncbi:hypothetical protein SVIOM74S_02873 [Streptomyces violarus]